MTEDPASHPTRTFGFVESVTQAGGIQPTLGRYRLLGRLGEGGMGEVWIAEQETPVRRRVAVKLIKVGKDSAQVLARFQSERQALALMNHPNIAQVFDAGTAADGRPFFAMELVQGEPITTYCDRRRLGVNQRLSLFLQVCEGVQHAHQKGVIHRDIKPSNVLVSGDAGAAVCKIIDFGVAKAIEPPPGEQLLVTRAGLAVGTPAYMSPEQAGLSGLDVDTRTDVYSLGVLLYELLIGELPFDAQELGRAGTEETFRRLREDEPPLPSRKFSSFEAERADRLAASRHSESLLLRRRLTGDLDWIVMKAIEKDRARRYGSPGELAADVERSLRDEPVSAGPPSAGYRLRKFVRRHRLAVAGSALVGGALIAGLALALWGFVHARRSEAMARREAAAAEQTATFLIDLFQVSSPDQAKGRTITARELLDRGAQEIRARLSGQPALQARMMHTIGQVYERLALYDDAQPLLEESLAIRRRLLGDDHPDTLDAMARLAHLKSQRGEFAGVEETLRGVLASRRRQGGNDAPATLAAMAELAGFLHVSGQPEESEALYREVLEKRRRAPGVDPRDLYTTMRGLASVLQDRGRGDEAESLYRKAEEGLRRTFGSDDTQRLLTQNDLATLLVSRDNLAESETIFRELLEAHRRIFGPDHPETLTTVNNLGVVLSLEGKLAEAEPLYREALERRRRLLGEDHPETLFSIHNMGGLLADQGKLEEAEHYRREAWERRRRILGPDHPDTLEAASNLGEILHRLGRLSEAEARFREAVDGRRRVLGPEHADTLLSLAGLARTLQKEGRLDDATAAWRELLAAYPKTRPEGDPLIGAAMSSLGECLGARAASEEAESMLLGGFEILDRASSTPPASQRDAILRIVRYYERAGSAALAAPWRARLEAVAARK